MGATRANALTKVPPSKARRIHSGFVQEVFSNKERWLQASSLKAERRICRSEGRAKS